MPNRPKVRNQQGKGGARAGGSRPQSGKSQGGSSRSGGGRARSESESRGRTRAAAEGRSRAGSEGRSARGGSSTSENRGRGKYRADSEGRRPRSFNLDDKPAGGKARYGADSRGAGRTSQFDSDDKPAAGRPRFGTDSRGAGRASRFDSDDKPDGGKSRYRADGRGAGRTSRFDSDDKGAGRPSRFDSDDRGTGRKPRFDSDDRGTGRKSRFDSDDRGTGRKSRFDSNDRGPRARARFDTTERGPRGQRLGSDERGQTGRPRTAAESRSTSGKGFSEDEVVTEDGTEMIFGKNAVLAFLEDNEDAPTSDSEFAHDDDDEAGDSVNGDKSDDDNEAKSTAEENEAEHAASLKRLAKTEFVGPRGQVRKPEIGKIYLVQLDRPDRKIERIKALAKSQRIPVAICDRRKLDSMVGPDQLHQGVAAQISAAEFWELSDFLDELKRSSPNSLDGNVVAIVDGIEDPHNLGAIIRVAESAGLKGLLLPARRSAGLTGIVAKTSAGALASLPIVRIHNLTQAVEELKEAGFWIAGLDSNEGDLYTKTDLVRPLALVVGSEGTGMTRLVKENCDMLLKIPMLGKTESLNASVAAGIVFYEVVRQLQAKNMIPS